MQALRAVAGGLILMSLGCGSSNAGLSGSAGAAMSASGAAGSAGVSGSIGAATGGSSGASGSNASAAGNGGAAPSMGGASAGTNSGGTSGNGVSGGASGHGGAGRGGAAGSGVGGGAVGPACAIPATVGGSCKFADYCTTRWGGSFDNASAVMQQCASVETFVPGRCPSAGVFGYCAGPVSKGSTEHAASFQYSAAGAAYVAPQCVSYGGTWCAPQ